MGVASLLSVVVELLGAPTGGRRAKSSPLGIRPLVRLSSPDAVCSVAARGDGRDPLRRSVIRAEEAWCALARLQREHCVALVATQQSLPGGRSATGRPIVGVGLV